MATTIKESFRQFATNLNISDKQEGAVSTSRANAVKKISEKLSLNTGQQSRLIGSYDRDTLIRYFSEGDVDVMVVLHYGDNKEWDCEGGASKALTKFKAILQEAYPKTICRIDRNCVTMKLSSFNLDIVPAFKHKAGYYSIPDTYRDKWLRTDPTEFASEISRINKNMGGSFVPFIKMIKGWNRKYANKLRSFHLECMLVKHYKNCMESYTYESMASAFFSQLPGYLTSAAYDPIGGDRVDLYLDNSSLGNKRETFVIRARIAAKKAKVAHEDGSKYDPVIAIEEWKALFGEFFPTYG